MAYLIGDYPELSIVTMVDGEEQNFFNEQDKLHMWDVKNLFLGGLKLRAMAIPVIAMLIVVLMATKADLKRLLAKSYFRALAISAVAVAVIGVFVATNFNKVFILFHEIFFTNDLWLFDPRTDYMIRMLPEGFFFDMVVRIGGLFILSITLAAVLAFAVQKKIKQN